MCGRALVIGIGVWGIYKPAYRIAKKQKESRVHKYSRKELERLVLVLAIILTLQYPCTGLL